MPILIEPELTTLEERVEERKLLEHRFGTQESVTDSYNGPANRHFQEAAVEDEECESDLEMV